MACTLEIKFDIATPWRKLFVGMWTFDVPNGVNTHKHSGRTMPGALGKRLDVEMAHADCLHGVVNMLYKDWKIQTKSSDKPSCATVSNNRPLLSSLCQKLWGSPEHSHQTFLLCFRYVFEVLGGWDFCTSNNIFRSDMFAQE